MKQGDEVIYTIQVSGLTSSVKRDHAQRVLSENGVPSAMHIVKDNTLTVPRLFTQWRGDDAEKVWQEAIKASLPQAIFDVQPWSYAPGYPKGELGDRHGSE